METCLVRRDQASMRGQTCGGPCRGPGGGRVAPFPRRAGLVHFFCKILIHLREFALCYERHPESMRTVPWLRPAGRVPNPVDPVDWRDPADEFQIDVYEPGECSETPSFLSQMDGFKSLKTLNRRLPPEDSSDFDDS